MEITRRNVCVTFTILCLAASLLTVFSIPGSILLSLTENLFMNQEAGVLRRLSWLFHSPWTDTLVSYVFLIGLAYIPAGLMVCRLPKASGKPKSISGAEFLLCFAAAMGVGYCLNFVGNGINFFFGFFTHKTLEEMNPVVDMAADMSPSMLIYACFLGPFMEELMFRGILLKRARAFGDRTAVVFTAVMFGLMHGNVAQFLYAAAIGLIFGYVAVRTNRIFYTVILHIMVNSFGTVLAAGAALVAGIGVEALTALYSLGFLGTLLFMIIGGLIAAVKCMPSWYRWLTAHNGPPSPAKKYVYLNPGFFLYLAACGAEMWMFLF